MCNWRGFLDLRTLFSGVTPRRAILASNGPMFMGDGRGVSGSPGPDLKGESGRRDGPRESCGSQPSGTGHPLGRQRTRLDPAVDASPFSRARHGPARTGSSRPVSACAAIPVHGRSPPHRRSSPYAGPSACQASSARSKRGRMAHPPRFTGPAPARLVPRTNLQRR